MKIMMAILATLFVGSLVAEAADQPRVIYRKKTVIRFDDAVVEGELANPEGVYIVKAPEKKFGSLLKLRPHFHRELMRDALLLK